MSGDKLNTINPGWALSSKALKTWLCAVCLFTCLLPVEQQTPFEHDTHQLPRCVPVVIDTTSQRRRHKLLRNDHAPFLSPCSRRHPSGGNVPAHDKSATPQPLSPSPPGAAGRTNANRVHKTGDLSTVWWACVWQGHLRVYRSLGDSNPKVRAPACYRGSGGGRGGSGRCGGGSRPQDE